MKTITVGIPAYHAEDHIINCLASIRIQTIKDMVSIVIAKDHPDDNYDLVLKQFPDLDIKILDCEKNTGPGLARQRALDACKTDWITFIDADDVFFTPFALETLLSGVCDNTVIEVQGVFMQELNTPLDQNRLVPINNAGHPWVFGRLYNVGFLRANSIEFSSLRAMEDGELNWKIRMLLDGGNFHINLLDTPVYLWCRGSEHSITRIGVDENGIPQYNFDLCQWGATEAAIGAINFCKKRNPFNGEITRFTVETLIGFYFTYIECLERKPIFAEQNLFNAKKFYNVCYKRIEEEITQEIINDMYTMQLADKAQELIGIIPQITFFEFLDKIKNEEYRGDEEFQEIRARLPQEIIDNDIKSGVFGRDD